MAKLRRLMFAPTFTIVNVDVGGGAVTAEGNDLSAADGALLGVYGKVVNRDTDDPNDHANPWDFPNPRDPVAGQVTAATNNTWTVAGMPLPAGAVNCTLRVWGVYEGQAGFAVSNPYHFSVGSGSGGGAAAPVGVSPLTSGVKPRYYHLWVDPVPPTPGDPQPAEAARAVGGGAILLEYDPLASGPERVVWRQARAGDGAGWTLHVSDDCGGLEATVAGRGPDGRPLVWRAPAWRFLARNALRGAAPHSAEVFVEPAR